MQSFVSKALTFGTVLTVLIALSSLSPALLAHEPEFTQTFDRDRCNFTTVGNNPYFPLWPGYALEFEGEELDDDGELVTLENTITVLYDTERVDGVLTRVIEEREREDGELAEISRNFFAICRETGDVWYFGEDVDDYDDGMVVGHDGQWRAGLDGAEPGILMPGTPLLGARHYQENAPGVAADIGEIISLSETLTVPAGTFHNLLYVEEGSALDPEDFSAKWYAYGIGLVKDDVIELAEIIPPPCLPDSETHCLSDGRFHVQAEWGDAEGNEGMGEAILASGQSGEFWFFSPGNTELLVKVLDACDLDSNAFWVFAAGLTNVEVTLTVTDTLTGQVNEYENPLGRDFEPVLDTGAFFTCDAVPTGDDDGILA